MITKVKKYIEENQMIVPGDHILLGVSGGADSVCLFFLLDELREEWKITLTVAHVNHMLRENAVRDEKFVKELCAQKHIPCHIVREPVGEIAVKQKQSPEEAGREVRYRVFAEIAGKVGANKIAVAHNRNDQTETVLFHLFRGSGLSGLTGMQPVRGNIIRPLLCVSRQEIEQYIGRQEIRHITDESNAEDIYRRNVLRNQIIPLINEKICQGADRHIADTADVLREAQDYLTERTGAAMKRVFDGSELRLTPFLQEHEYIQKSIAALILENMTGSKKDIGRIHIEQVLALVSRQVGKTVRLPYGIRARRTYDGIRFEKVEAEADNREEINVVLQVPGVTNLTNDIQIVATVFPHGKTEDIRAKIPQKTYTKWFDYDKIVESLNVRNRKTGDYFFFDSQENEQEQQRQNHLHRKAIKSYMIDEKIPKEVRGTKLLIAEGSHVLWVVGHRISSYYKVDETTSRILELIIRGGHEDV